MKLRYFLWLLLFSVIISGCDKPDTTFKSGIWRAALLTESGEEIPFNFEVVKGPGINQMVILNGEERFAVNEITLEKDSVFIQMPLFDSEIKGSIMDGKIEGVWIKHLAQTDAVMTFTAEHNIKWRIKKEGAKPVTDLTGKWATSFVSEDGKDTTIAVGEFKQDGAKVTGTFLTTTGDYRFLDGMLDGKKLSLSAFDGSHAFLFTANVSGKELKDGKFYSGFSGTENWMANQDKDAKLPDAYSLTYLKPGFKKIDFTFPNLDGEKISLKDEKYKNKVVIVQMLGSWCPNCMDETSYLAPFYKKNKDLGVEVIGLAYERNKDFERSKANINRLKKRFDVKYDLLVTGYTNDKDEASQSLPMLNKVLAFPTMIIIDKKGDVRKIHTGFSGPGTGKYYAEFVNEFEKQVKDLLAE